MPPEQPPQSHDQDRDAEGLFAALYEELRGVAHHILGSADRQITLQPTVLVHEAFLKLLRGSEQPRYRDDAHFFSTAAKAMRHILIDAARQRLREKRGGDRQRVTLGDTNLGFDPHDHQLLALDEAIEELKKHDATAAQVVVLRVFGGLGVKEAAQVVGASPATIKREWSFARAWLHDRVGESG